MENVKRETPKYSFLENIRGAYDLSSCGMGVQLFCVKKLFQLNDLSDWDKDALSGMQSNYLATPYILAWLYPERDLALYVEKPIYECPNSAKHRALFKTAYLGYDQLSWQVMREVLGGDAISTADPRQPISDL